MIKPKAAANVTLVAADNGQRKSSVGDDLLSQGLAPQLPSALKSLTTGFGMGPGVPSSLTSPTERLHFVSVDTLTTERNKNQVLQSHVN